MKLSPSRRTTDAPSPARVEPAREARIAARRHAHETRQAVRTEELREALRQHRRQTFAMGLLVVLGLGTALAVFALQNLRRHSTGPKPPAIATAETEATISPLGDAVITAQVRSALAADPRLKALKIDVATTRGVVRLDGPVPDATSRDQASVLAAAPQGVRDVDNRLSLQPTAVVAAKPVNPRRNVPVSPTELLNAAPTAAGPSQPASQPATHAPIPAQPEEQPPARAPEPEPETAVEATA